MLLFRCALVRQVFQSGVDLRPDPQNQTLTIRLHRLSTAAHDEALSHLCEELTATETVYPGTDLKIIYEVVGGKTDEAQDGPQPDPPARAGSQESESRLRQLPRGQEV